MYMGGGEYRSNQTGYGWNGRGADHHYQFGQMNQFHHQQNSQGYTNQFNSSRGNMGYNAFSRGNQHQRGGRGGGRGHLSKPWITHEIRNEINHRNFLSHQAKQSKAAPDFDALNDQKTKVYEMIEEAKRKYFIQNPEEEGNWLHILARESFSKSTWCDVCDKGFDSIRQLREHESEHVTCDVDGCKYTGHQSVMEKHIQHQHISGFFHRIPQGKSKEEIDKWRAERRKNFPTSDKVAIKDAERAEAQARGEVMRYEKIIKKYTGVEEEIEEDKSVRNRNVEPDWECNCKARYFLKDSKRRVDVSKLKHQNHCQELVRIRERAVEKKKEKHLQLAKKRLERYKEKNHKSIPQDQVVQLNTENLEDSESETEEMNGTLPMFAGLGKSFLHNTAYLNPTTATQWSDQSDHDFDISDDDEDMVYDALNDVHFTDITYHDETYAETSLILDDVIDSKEEGSHNLDADNIDLTDDDDGPPEDIKIEKGKDVDILDTSDNHDNLIKSETSVNEEILKTVTEENPKGRKRKRKDETNETPSMVSADKKAKTVFTKRIGAPTLLEKLLHDEIKRERNIILQCVRYVCNNQFLQDQQK